MLWKTGLHAAQNTSRNNIEHQIENRSYDVIVVRNSHLELSLYALRLLYRDVRNRLACKPERWLRII